MSHIPKTRHAFFGAVHASVRQFFRDRPEGPLQVDIELTYFNSSSAKALMNLFQAFEEAAEESAKVDINWHFQENDSAIREFGEDFAIDFRSCTFNLKAKAKVES